MKALEEYVYGNRMALASLLPAWVYLVFYAEWANEDTLFGITYHSPLYWASAGTMVAVSLAYFLFSAKMRTHLHRRWVFLAAPIALCVATFALIVPSERGGALAFSASFAAGVFSAVMSLQWAWTLGQQRLDEIISSMPTMLAIAVALCLTLAYVPVLPARIIIAFVPLLAGLGPLNAYEHECNALGDAAVPASELAKASDVARQNMSRGEGVVLFILVGVYSISVGFIDTLMAGAQRNIYFLLIAAVYMLSCGAYICFNSRNRISGGIVIPAFLLVVVLVPYTALTDHAIYASLLSTGALCSEIILYTLPICYARYARLAAPRIYAFTRVLYLAFVEVGTQVSQWALGSGIRPAAGQISAILFILGIEALAAILVFIYLRTRRESEDSAEVAAAEVDSEPAAPQISFEDRCRLVAADYRLTNREVDVMTMLAKGFASSKIQSELFLSEGTVKFHTRNVYAKMGVHSRQELIDIIQKRVGELM